MTIIIFQIQIYEKNYSCISINTQKDSGEIILITILLFRRSRIKEIHIYLFAINYYIVISLYKTVWKSP
jgi:hypothetical protein